MLRLSLSPSPSLSACVYDLVFLCSLALYVSLSPSLELSLRSQAKCVSGSLSLSKLVCWDLRLFLSVSVFCLHVLLHPYLCLCLVSLSRSLELTPSL